MEHERFAALVSPHAEAMARVAAALVGIADAEDAAQEALLRAWRGWPTLRDPEAARPWLLRITVNVCRNWQAGHFGLHRRSTEPLEARPGDAGGANAGGPGTSDHAAALDLHDAIAGLNPDLRQAVALRYFAGMDATEIGMLLDVPPPTVRTRLRRALTRLRTSLAASGAGSAAFSSGSKEASDVR
jgi:RNA polymerase sigma-70 factor (ECF subfamily)